MTEKMRLFSWSHTHARAQIKGLIVISGIREKACTAHYKAVQPFTHTVHTEISHYTTTTTEGGAAPAKVQRGT